MLKLCVHRTGYTNIREMSTALFGNEVIDQVDDLYGLDEEGEVRGSYRPSGYPGVSDHGFITAKNMGNLTFHAVVVCDGCIRAMPFHVENTG